MFNAPPPPLPPPPTFDATGTHIRMQVDKMLTIAYQRALPNTPWTRSLDMITWLRAKDALADASWTQWSG